MNTDVLWLQNKLKEEGSCSVAQLMHWCGLTYPQAVELLQLLINRGWLEPRIRGMAYAVQPENLKLRKLQRSEAEKLYPQLTRRQVRVLSCIADGKADHDQMRKPLRSVLDLPEILQELIKWRLIYCYDERYYLCISRSEAKLLEQLLWARPERLIDQDVVADPVMWQMRAQKILDDHYGAAS